MDEYTVPETYVIRDYCQHALPPALSVLIERLASTNDELRQAILGDADWQESQERYLHEREMDCGRALYELQEKTA